MFPFVTVPNSSLNHQWTSTLSKSVFEKELSKIDVWSFSPDYSQGLYGEPSTELFQRLFPSVGNRGKALRLQALQAVLFALAQCVCRPHNGRHVGFIHGRKNQRKSILSRYKTHDFSITLFTEVLDALVEFGFVKYHLGFNSENRKGLATLWTPTASFKDWWLQNAMELNQKLHYVTTECILLKDASNKQLLDYEDTKQTMGMRSRVRLSNHERLKYKWAYSPLSDDRQFEEGIHKQPLPASSLMCRRIFNGDLSSGGRHYCNAQHLRKIERETITIDGKPTIELDYKSLHPRMLYNEEGLEAPIDCYASEHRSRELTKMVSLYSINCKSLVEAKHTLMKNAGISMAEASGHLNEYINEHEVIAHRFFKSGWARLQNLDSQLVEDVLHKACENGVPVLPVHDSFIVPTQHAFWVKDALLESYKTLMGFDAVIDW